MKRLIVAIAVALVGMVVAPESVSAQFDISKLGGVFGGSSSKPKVSPYKTLADNAPSKSEVLGVWQYSDFDLEYLGSNSLAETAIGQVESYARVELQAAGVKAGCFTITLHNDGSGSFSYEDYIYEGSYTYDASKAHFVMTTSAYDGTTITLTGFLKINKGKLVVMVKAEDAIKAFTTILPEVSEGDDSTFEMINGVVQSFPGIFISMHYNR